MRTFDGDDDGYLAWLSANQGGYVVNTFRRPGTDYLVLHKAACKSISRTAANPIPWTTGPYIKVCATSLSELEQWAGRENGGTLAPCGQCHPVASF